MLSLKVTNTLPCRCSTFALSRIGKLRRYLDQAITQKLIQAFAISRLDHYHFLILKIQNMAVCPISLTKKSVHITPILRDKLHWFPVDQRIIFKILLLTLKVLHSILPKYLFDLLHLYVPARDVRAGTVRPRNNHHIVRSLATILVGHLLLPPYVEYRGGGRVGH